MSEGSVQAAHGGLLSELMDTIRLLLFTTLWTAIWPAPLPKLSRRVELVAGLIPFAAFGLRVFASCFIGVPADDPVRMAVAPLVDWVNGGSGAVPFQSRKKSCVPFCDPRLRRTGRKSTKT